MREEKSRNSNLSRFARHLVQIFLGSQQTLGGSGGSVWWWWEIVNQKFKGFFFQIVHFNNPTSHLSEWSSELFFWSPPSLCYHWTFSGSGQVHCSTEKLKVNWPWRWKYISCMMKSLTFRISWFFFILLYTFSASAASCVFSDFKFLFFFSARIFISHSHEWKPYKQFSTFFLFEMISKTKSLEGKSRKKDSNEIVMKMINGKQRKESRQWKDEWGKF